MELMKLMGGMATVCSKFIKLPASLRASDEMSTPSPIKASCSNARNRASELIETLSPSISISLSHTYYVLRVLRHLQQRQEGVEQVIEVWSKRQLVSTGARVEDEERRVEGCELYSCMHAFMYACMRM